jgi:hypothetical protein
MVYYIDTQTSSGIKDFASKLSGYSHTGYTTLWTNAKNDYCSDFSHYLDKVRGEETCKSLDEHGKLIKDYCGLGDNITKTECGKNSLKDYGHLDIYNELSQKYCDANPDKEFCACYNVTQPGLCDQLPNLPGCKTVKPVWDKITSSLDEGDIAQFEGMQPCYGSVCSGNVYQPTSWDVNCNRDISICKADFDIGGDLLGSNISLKQDCGKEGSNGETTTENKDGDGDEKKSLTEKLFKFEEDKDKKLIEKQSTKIFGTVSSVSSCFMCMTALVLFT